MTHIPKDDLTPQNPFGQVSAGRDELSGALTADTWRALYQIDKLIKYALEKGVHIAVRGVHLAAHSIVEIVERFVLTDAMAIYAAASGLNDMYVTITAQGDNLSRRYVQGAA